VRRRVGRPGGEDGVCDWHGGEPALNAGGRAPLAAVGGVGDDHAREVGPGSRAVERSRSVRFTPNTRRGKREFNEAMRPIKRSDAM